MCQFQRAVGDHLSIQEDTLLLIQLKEFVKHRDLARGTNLHAEIVKNGLLERNIYIGTTLISLYVKCGAPAMAQHVINELPVQNIVSWNALIAGHAQNGHGELAINCFERMQFEGLSPDAVSLACVLKACASIQAIERGTKIHAEIARKGFLGNDIVLGNALLDMYGKCGALVMAEQVFHEMPVKNVISWTVIIGGCCLSENGKRAICTFERMQDESLSPDKVTLLCILQASGSIGDADKGRRFHAVICSDGVMKKDSVLGDALVDMYVKCGALDEAYNVFCELPCRSIFSWTSLVTGYCQHGHSEAALKCFQQMKREGFSIDAVTYACILKCCGDLGAAEVGEQIHQEVVDERLLGKDGVLSTALVDMYAKCGELVKAQQVFDDLPYKDVATWNVLMTGYCERGLTDNVINCYHQMTLEAFCANAVTFACVLKVCGCLRNLNIGLEIHSEIARKGLIGNETILGSALVDMYAACGALWKAKEVFDQLCHQDTVCWTALIGGYCQHGHVEEALDLFDEMEEQGFSPDAVTFACILKACGSIGAVKEGEFYFESMINRYNIIPTLEDHTHMMELFGHAGCFDKAVAVVNRMPSLDYLPAWSALMSACKKWGNVKLGKIAYNHVIRLDRKPVVAYLSLSSIYAVAGMHDDADRTLTEAQQLFDKSPFRDVVSWNALIAAFYECGCYNKAILSYERMKQEGVEPNVITILCILKVCAREVTCDSGKKVHHDLRRLGKLSEESNVVGTALVDMYAKCGEFAMAKQVFEKLRYQNITAWNALIAGYSQHGRCEEVMVCSEQMKYEGLPYDVMTFSCILKACGTMQAIE